MPDRSIPHVTDATGVSQDWLAERLGTSQSTISRRSRYGQPLSEAEWERVFEVFRDDPEVVARLLEEPSSDDVFRVTVGPDGPVEPRPDCPEMEDAALVFAQGSRSAFLRDRLGHRCALAGLELVPTPGIPYALCVRTSPPAAGGPPEDLTDLLLPHGGGAIGLRDADVLVLGSPFQHPTTQRLLLGLGGFLDTDIEFVPSPGGRFVFVGYPSRAVTLMLAGTPHTATRTVLPNDDVRYTDVGVVLCAPLDRVVSPGQHPFGPEARRLVLAGGTRRLGTGIASALVENPAALARLGLPQTLPESGGFAFEVEAIGGARTRITRLTLLQVLSAAP